MGSPPERWKQVERIYQDALDRPADLRQGFLDEVCAGDAELRAEVESLLSAYRPEDRFLETDALTVTARALASRSKRMTKGHRLGPYELLGQLGAGGMGEVWRALDPALNREVAIKILLPQYSCDPDRLRRFEQEAKAAGRLNHPNILAIHAIGEEAGSPYLVTELLEGATLRQRLTTGPINETKAAEYASQMAEGLAAAHDKKIVHRDLKPDNVFITADGRVKILDFGLAKLLEARHGTGGETETASGTALGTPAYMAPEQVRGQAVDHRADIFALGVVLYEMVAGRRPFEGKSSAETMNAILNHEPPPVANCSPALVQTIRHCLEKEPGERFQSARDLAFQLRHSSSTVIPRAAGKAVRRGGLAWGVAALGALAVVVGVVWRTYRIPGGAPTTNFVRITSDSGLTTDPAFSADGKLVAYASDRGGQGNLDIWRYQPATSEAIRLTTDPFDESEPDFAPDASRIAFRSERDGGGIYVISAFGGSEPRLVASKGRRPRFSPDGASIAYWVGSWYMGKSYVAPLAGGSAKALQAGFISTLYPIWSQDGKSLLFVGAKNAEDVFDFDWWVAAADGGEPVKTGAFPILGRSGIRDGTPSLVAPAAWIGDRVYFSAKLNDVSSLWSIAVSPKTGKASGAPQQLTTGTAVVSKPSLSASGQLVFAALTENLNIWRLPIDANRGKVTGEVQRVTDGAMDAHTSVSADGTKLVFTSTRSGNPDVWLKDLTTGKETALTTTPLAEEQPEITPDGSKVGYMVPNGARSFAIELVSTNGGVPERLCEDCFRLWDWSPDGSKLLYLIPEGRGKNADPTISLGLFDMSKRQKIEYLHHPKHNLARQRFSPDGKWIAMMEDLEPLFNRIIIVRFDHAAPAESEWISIAESARHDKPRWSPDGNLMYYMSNRDGYYCIWARRLDPATKRPAGAAFDVYHSHSARQSLGNAGIRFQEISFGRGQMLFNLGEVTGNVWMAQIGLSK